MMQGGDSKSMSATQKGSSSGRRSNLMQPVPLRSIWRSKSNVMRRITHPGRIPKQAVSDGGGRPGGHFECLPRWAVEFSLRRARCFRKFPQVEWIRLPGLPLRLPGAEGSRWQGRGLPELQAHAPDSCGRRRAASAGGRAACFGVRERRIRAAQDQEEASSLLEVWRTIVGAREPAWQGA